MKEPEINRTKKLNKDQYYPIYHKKSQIYLHHTAGMTADGAINWWNQTPQHVGTAYVIDRDGTIYEVFDPNCWGYHLGVHGDDDRIEKESIGIEIVAAGRLYKEENKFLFYPLYPNKTVKKEISEEEVVGYEKYWRGHQYFHKYTDKQVENLTDLIYYLCKKFGIKIQPDERAFYIYDEKVITEVKPGLWSHSTVRQDKDDIVPYDEFEQKITMALREIKAELQDEKNIYNDEKAKKKKKNAPDAPIRP